MSKVFLDWPTFPTAAERATKDEQLRANVRRATHTIRAKRGALAAERPDWQDLRDSAAAVKDEVLRHLDTYLEQLEAKVREAGGVVHWAQDAEEANRIVTGLVQETGETEIVKVKSMLTEEIGLDSALEKAGISARETDLAAAIVQLGDDLPEEERDAGDGPAAGLPLELRDGDDVLAGRVEQSACHVRFTLSRSRPSQGGQDSNLQPAVLETAALPIELQP